MNSQFPLKLNRYFFPKLNITANPKHDPSGNKMGSKVTNKVSFYRGDDATSTLIADITITVPLDEGDNPPYSIDVTVFGTAELPDNNLETPISLAAMEATLAQVLYGAAREMVQLMTARGPWGEFVLPIFSLPRRLPTEAAPPQKTSKTRKTVVKRKAKATT